MRNWLRKRWLRTVIVVALGSAATPWLVGYGIAYFKGSWNLAYNSSVTDNYQIFRDLLVIFSAFATIGAGLGVWTYDKFKKGIRLQIEEEMKQHELVLVARSNAMSSYHDWEEYEYLWLREGKHTQEAMDRINIAMSHAQLAYEIMQKANEETREKNGRLVCQIKSHLAYHLAAR